MKKLLHALVAFMLMVNVLFAAEIEYNIDTTPELAQKVDFKSQIIKVTYAAIKDDYIKIQTIPTVSQNMATMFVSKNTATPSVNNFSYLAREKNTNTIYVPKPYLKEGQTEKLFFHIGIECIQNCDYKIIITFEKAVILAHDTKYFFFTEESAPTLAMRVKRIPEDNVLMIFALGGAKEDVLSYDLKYQNRKTEGSLPVDIPMQELFYNGVAAVFNEKGKYTPGEDAYYELILTTKPKSYMAIGVRNMSKVSEILAFEVTYGLLDKTDNKKDCFKYNEGIPEPGAEHLYTLNVDTFTQNAFIYLTPDEKEEQTDIKYQWRIEDSNYILINKQDLIANYICVKPIESSTTQYVSYSLHLVDNLDFYDNQARNLPRVNGLISTHFLDKSKITFYRYYKRTPGTKKVTMTMKVIQGNPIAYAHLNENYPDYRYSLQTLNQLEQDGKLIKSHRLNDFFSLSVEDTGEPLVSTKQNVLIIQCLKNEPFDEDCIFQLSFDDDADSILLKPNENYAGFIHKGKIDRYQVIIKNSDPAVQKFLVNLYSFSGDSGISISLSATQKEEKVYAGNKQIITVTGEDTFELVGSYSIEVTGFTNGYYSINYIPITTTTGKIVTIESGSALLETISMKEGKTQVFNMKNKRRNQKGSFVTTFFPLNCKLSVRFIGKDPAAIEAVDDLFQHAQRFENPDYSVESYPYEVTVVSMETQVDTCMIYISGNEILPKEGADNIRKELVLNEASSYQIVLNEDTLKMSYIYPHPAIDGDVIASFALEEGLLLQVTVRIEEKVFPSFLIKRSRQIVVEKKQLDDACVTKDYLCNVIFDVVVVNPDALTKKQMFDVQIRSESKTPGYMKKSYMVLDTMKSNRIQYYSTEIDKNEEGEISLNFKRGSGKMFARLVKKEVVEENPDWNGKVKLPTEASTDLLEYNAFLKKIIISNDQSSKCTNGCDIYIGITAEDKYEADVSFLTDYSIFFIKKSVPVNVDFNEFINGHIIEITKPDLYQITIPYDTTKLRIDFQSQICDLYGKRGMPDGSKHDWKFEAKKNGVFIIESPFKKNDVLSFRVVAGEFNKIYSATYIIKFDIPANNRADLILINSDQNILCQTAVKDSYCYFLFPINTYDHILQLSLYAYTEDFTTVSLHVNVDDMIEFDRKTDAEIEAILPKKSGSTFSSEKSLQKDVLIITDPMLMSNVYVLIGVFVPIPTTLTLITTFRTRLTTMVLNPVSMQLIVMESSKSIDLMLPDRSDYLVNIAGLIGKGTIELVNTNAMKYQLADRRNLALVTDKTNKLIRVTSGDKFVFSVYNVIRPQENFDEIENATTNEIIYKEKDLPLIFYSKVYDEEEDITINININSLLKTGDKLDEFDILGLITNENIINQKKKNKNVNPDFAKSISGKYDLSMKTGKIYFKSSFVKEYETNLRKYLYVSFNKRVSNTNKYSGMHATISTTPSANHDFPIAANTYFHYNLIRDQVKSSVFQLIKNDKSDKYLQLEFAGNSDKLNFVYLNMEQKNPDTTYTNSTDIKVESQRSVFGKTILLFNLADSKNAPDNILISVFFNSEDHKVDNEYLSNYVLKYSTSIQPPEIISLKNDGKVKHVYTNSTKALALTFDKVVDANKKVVDAKYYVRIIPNSEYRNSESHDTITLMDSKNPRVIELPPKEEDPVNVIITDFPDDKAYIVSLLARTNQGEMLIYKSIQDPADKDKTPEKEGKNFPLWLIILISVISVLVLAGVIGIFFYVKKLSGKFGKPEEEIEKVDEGKIGLMTND